MALSQKSCGVRILKGGSQEQISQALGEASAKLKQKVEGLTWWKIDKLNESELFNVEAFIEAMGLQIHGGVRKSRRGKYWRVIFQAKGTPPSGDNGIDFCSKALLKPLYPDKSVLNEPSMLMMDKPSGMMMDCATGTAPAEDEQDLVGPLKEEILELKTQMEQLINENQVLKEALKIQKDQTEQSSLKLNATLVNVAEMSQALVELKGTFATMVQEMKELKCDNATQLKDETKRFNELKCETQAAHEDVRKTLQEKLQRFYELHIRDFRRPPSDDDSFEEAFARSVPIPETELKTVGKKRGRGREGRGRGDPPPPPEQQKPYDPHRDYSREFFSDPNTLADFFPTPSGAGRGRRGGR